MNRTDHSPLLESPRLREELQTTLDDRTLEILDRRQRTAVVKRRGWLVRRMLVAADVVGLLSGVTGLWQVLGRSEIRSPRWSASTTSTSPAGR
jgi:hypothetical protein